MSTQTSESVTLQALNVEDGCQQFEIYANTSESANLITTISASDFLEGITLSGSNNHNTYEIVCLDGSGVNQNQDTLTYCSSSTNLEDEPCDNTKTYSGNEVFPAVYIVPLGLETGSVELFHNALNVPDKFVVDWSGSVVFNSGYVGSVGFQSQLNTELSNLGYDSETITNTNPGNITATIGNAGAYPGFGSGSFQKNTPNPTFCTVRVYGPLPGTAWHFLVNCPSGSVDTDAVVPDFITIPSGNSSCVGSSQTLGGTLTIEEGDDEPASNSTVTFTVPTLHQAVVRVTGSMSGGFIANSASAELLDNSDNVIQEFKMFHETDGATTSFSPSSFTVTGSSDSATTTYKLKAYSVPTDDGNGNIGLYVDTCVTRSSYENEVNATVGKSAGSGANSRVKVVWPQTDSSENYEKAIDARQLTEFLTGRGSVSTNVWYTFDYDIIVNSGIIVIDEATGNEVGDIVVYSNSQIRYWNETPTANELVVEMKNVNPAGDIAAGFIPLELYQYFKK